MKSLARSLYRIADWFGESLFFQLDWPTPVGRILQIVFIPLNIFGMSVFGFLSLILALINWVIYGREKQ